MDRDFFFMPNSLAIMTKKEILLVSSCLLGCKCRYNGTDSFHRETAELQNKFLIESICPEVLIGLPTPRSPVEIQNGQAIDKNGNNLTKEFEDGANKTLEIVKAKNIKAAILKSNSPSCGCDYIYDGSFSGKKIPGQGFTAKLLMKNGIFVVSENDIDKLL